MNEVSAHGTDSTLARERLLGLDEFRLSLWYKWFLRKGKASMSGQIKPLLMVHMVP